MLDDLAVYRMMYPPIGEGFIFRTATGHPVDPDNFFKHKFLPTVAAASLRHVGLHVLRHSYASLLDAEGANLKYISRQLGHASIKITADIYSHILSETSASTMKALDARIAATRTGRANVHLTDPAVPAENSIDQQGVTPGAKSRISSTKMDYQGLPWTLVENGPHGVKP